MKKNSLVGINTGIFSMVVILVLVASFALNACTPGQASKTANGTSLPALTNTPDPCAPQNLQSTVADLDKLTRQFDDTIQIAQSTPGDQLVPLITQLQTARRGSEDFTPPGCMENLKQLQLNYMNTYINTLLALYNSYSDMSTAKPYIAMATAYSGTATPPAVVKQYLTLFDQDAGMINQGISLAVGYHNQYEAEKARLLGVTLTPSPVPVLPVETPTPVPATAKP